MSTGLQLDLARNLYEREGDDGPGVHLTLLAESVPADMHAELVGAHVTYLDSADCKPIYPLHHPTTAPRSSIPRRAASQCCIR